jgi:hypothetical protein
MFYVHITCVYFVKFMHVWQRVNEENTRSVFVCIVLSHSVYACYMCTYYVCIL